MTVDLILKGCGRMSDIPSQPIEDVPARSRTTLMIVLAVVIVGGAIGVVWWYNQGPVTTKTYSKYGISFDYPASATVEEEGVLDD
jgi:hypothetical protein